MDFDLLSEIHKALSDQTRLRIVALLRVESLCVCELVEILGMSQPRISQHLTKLKYAKLVKENRVGSWVFHSLDLSKYPFLEEIMKALPDQQHEIEKLNEKGLRVTCMPTG